MSKSRGHSHSAGTCTNVYFCFSSLFTLWTLKLVDLNFTWVLVCPFIFPSNLHFMAVCSLHSWHHVWKITLCCHPGTSSCPKLVSCMSLLKRTREGSLPQIGIVIWLPVLSLCWYPDTFFLLKYNPGTCSFCCKTDSVFHSDKRILHRISWFFFCPPPLWLQLYLTHNFWFLVGWHKVANLHFYFMQWYGGIHFGTKSCFPSSQ